MSERVARSRELVARGKPVVVARVMQISRQAIYRTPARRPAKARRQGPPALPGRPGDRAIVEVALDNQTDGYRMVAALVTRKLGEAVNRKQQAGAARDARAAADPAAASARSASPARLLPRLAAGRALREAASASIVM